jgi:hypothetical protein
VGDVDYISDSVDRTDFTVYAIPVWRMELAVFGKVLDCERNAIVARGVPHTEVPRVRQHVQRQVHCG